MVTTEEVVVGMIVVIFFSMAIWGGIRHQGLDKMIPQDKARYVTNGRGWSLTEDRIITLLRNDHALNLSIRDISKGMFCRTKPAIAGRLLILRRQKRVL